MSDRYINIDRLLRAMGDGDMLYKAELEEWAEDHYVNSLPLENTTIPPKNTPPYPRNNGERENVFRIGKKGAKAPATELFQEYKDIVNDFLEVLEKNVPTENYHKCAEITEALTKSVIDDFEAKNCWYPLAFCSVRCKLANALVRVRQYYNKVYLSTACDVPPVMPLCRLVRAV